MIVRQAMSDKTSVVYNPSLLHHQSAEVERRVVVLLLLYTWTTLPGACP